MWARARFQRASIVLPRRAANPPGAPCHCLLRVRRLPSLTHPLLLPASALRAQGRKVAVAPEHNRARAHPHGRNGEPRAALRRDDHQRRQGRLRLTSRCAHRSDAERTGPRARSVRPTDRVRSPRAPVACAASGRARVCARECSARVPRARCDVHVCAVSYSVLYSRKALRDACARYDCGRARERASGRDAHADATCVSNLA